MGVTKNKWKKGKMKTKNGEKKEGGEKKGVWCQRKGDYKREGRRERRKRERVKCHGRKKGGHKWVIPGARQ